MDRFLASALDWLSEHGATLVSYVTETTRSLIRAVVEAGVEEGLNPREIARRLRREWPEVSALRAETIARTEALRAANVGGSAGHRQAAEDFGLILDKIWMATHDGRARESHRIADGQRVAFDAPFVVGGHLAMEPLDPTLPAKESVQCRCTTRVEVVGRRAVGGPKAERRERNPVRNAEIRAAYPALRDAHGKEVAMIRLGERYSLSPHTVKKVVYRTS